MSVFGVPFAKRRPPCHRLVVGRAGRSSCTARSLDAPVRVGEPELGDSTRSRGTLAMRRAEGVGRVRSGSRTRCSRSGASGRRRCLPRARAESSTRATRPIERIVASSRRAARAGSGPGRRACRGGRRSPCRAPLQRLAPWKKASAGTRSGCRLRFGPSTGLPIGSSSPNRIGSPPAPPRCSPRDRRADQRAVEVRRDGPAALGRLRVEEARVVRLVPERPHVHARDSGAPPASAKRPNSRALGRSTPERSPRVGRRPAGRGRAEREHHLEAARLGVGERPRRSAPSPGTAPGRAPSKPLGLRSAAGRDRGPVQLDLDHVRRRGPAARRASAARVRAVVHEQRRRPGRARTGRARADAAAGQQRKRGEKGESL